MSWSEKLKRVLCVVIVSTCCLYTCASQRAERDASELHLGHVQLDNPLGEMSLSRVELEEGSIQVLDEVMVFGPDSRMKRVSRSGPNPFSPAFGVEFIMLAPDTITIDVYAPESTLVRLHRGFLEEGRYTLQAGRADLPAGYYFFRCTVADTSMSRKCIWLR